MIRAIIHARKIIEKQVKQNSYDYISENFLKYQKGYYWTNENIAGYLSINLKNKENALCVAGTGDHIFNLIATGFKNIDSFDINKLTEYYSLGLKKAMIIKYDYYSFLMMMDLIASPGLPLETLTKILKNLLPYMDEKYNLFWSEIIDYNYKLQTKKGTNLNLIQMLYIGTFLPKSHINNNIYLLDEYCYEDFKIKLCNATITFKGIDALELSKHYKYKKYDVILLSNILDYANARWGDNWDYDKLEKYLNSLERITKYDGVIFYKYILSYIKDGITKDKIFHDSTIQRKDIKDEFYQLPKSTTTKEIDGIILRRVKIDK